MKFGELCLERRNTFDFETSKLRKALLKKEGACSRSLLYQYLTIMQPPRQCNSRATLAAQSEHSKTQIPVALATLLQACQDNPGLYLACSTCTCSSMALRLSYPG
jgi:hypothetical protein